MGECRSTSASTSALNFLSCFGFEVMGDDEFEEEEAKARAGGAAGVKQPESRRRHRLVEAADPADETVGGEEGQIIKADDRGVDRFGRDFGEERERYRQKMGEGDAVEKVKRDRPEEPDFLSRDLPRGGGEQSENAGDREDGAD
jgi:hypothetical protein